MADEEFKGFKLHCRSNQRYVAFSESDRSSRITFVTNGALDFRASIETLAPLVNNSLIPHMPYQSSNLEAQHIQVPTVSQGPR